MTLEQKHAQVTAMNVSKRWINGLQVWFPGTQI